MLTSNFAPRSVAWIATAALAVGWTGASLTTPAPTAQVSPGGPLPLGRGASSRAPGQSDRASVATLPERLHNYAPAAPLPSRGRNPFVYGVRPAPAQVHTAVESAPAAVPVPTAPEPPAMAFRLTGIASEFVDGMPSLTAILTVNGAMIFVKAGYQLPGGYAVVRVDEASVLLADATGVTQTLKLP